MKINSLGLTKKEAEVLYSEHNTLLANFQINY
jgi:hypothetical protein